MQIIDVKCSEIINAEILKKLNLSILFCPVFENRMNRILLLGQHFDSVMLKPVVPNLGYA
jgi:hypothetical protein